jgi:hypothetical protein
VQAAQPQFAEDFMSFLLNINNVMAPVVITSHLSQQFRAEDVDYSLIKVAKAGNM